jgi:hypothetical protein
MSNVGFGKRHTHLASFRFAVEMEIVSLEDLIALARLWNFSQVANQM